MASPRRPRGLAVPSDPARERLRVGGDGGEPQARSPAGRMARTAPPSRAAQVRGRAASRGHGRASSTGCARGRAVQRHAGLGEGSGGERSAPPDPARSDGGGTPSAGAVAPGRPCGVCDSRHISAPFALLGLWWGARGWWWLPGRGRGARPAGSRQQGVEAQRPGRVVVAT